MRETRLPQPTNLLKPHLYLAVMFTPPTFIQLGTEIIHSGVTPPPS